MMNPWDLLKSNFQVYFSIISNFFSDLLNKDILNITTIDLNTSPTNFQKVFPYLKLFSLIILIIVLVYVLNNLFCSYFNLSKQLILDNESQELKKTNPRQLNCVITPPFEHLFQTTDNQAIKLKGRTKRIPQPINYNELFNTNNKNSSSKKEKNSHPHFDNLISNKKINDNILDQQQVVCTIDDLFDKFNCIPEIPQSDKNESHMVDNPNLLLFEDDEKIRDTNPKNTYNDDSDNIKNEHITNINLIDDRSRLLDRLMQGNYIERTAITNMK